MNLWSNIIKAFDRKVSFKFLVTVIAATLLIFVIMFLWISNEQEHHIMEQVRKQAIILHAQIALTREWVAKHGTILAPKTEDLQPSPFLEDPLVKIGPEKTYIKVSPSTLTSILSDMALQDGLYAFRLRAPSPINPENSLDELETAAMKMFKQNGGQGVFHTEMSARGKVLRYIAPVKVSETCLTCHKSSGFEVGEVGGCLSVFIPMDNAANAIKNGSFMLLFGGLVLACALIGLVFLSARFIVFQRLSDLKESMKRLSKRKMVPNDDGPEDEIGELVRLCAELDQEALSRRNELDRKITEATRDLYKTNLELERANEELKSLDKAKKDFFTDISHEMRGPLSNIKGATALLKRKLKDKEAGYVDIITNNSDHLSKVVMDFLEYSKIESGYLELHIVKQPLKKVIDEAVHAISGQFQSNLVYINIHCDQTIEVPYDFKRIYQVLTNLLSNALRYSPTNSQVNVGVEPLNNEVLVYVSDMGPGIDPDYHEAIFKKFHQGPDSPGAPVEKGSSGIGLAICKGIVEAHRGRIWVQSELGQGSLFKFTLPTHGNQNESQ